MKVACWKGKDNVQQCLSLGLPYLSIAFQVQAG